MPVSQHADAKRILTSLSCNGVDAADPDQRGRTFNDKKITAHHAIVPTGELSKGLSKDEQAIYDMIAKRYVLQFLPDYIYQEIHFTLTVHDEQFTGSGKIVEQEGYRKYEKNEPDGKKKDEENVILPALQSGDTVETQGYEIKEKKTTPPKRFTEGTLLTAMANIWRYMAKDNPNREKLKEVKGIGTPATRDTIIAELLADKLKGKSIEPCLQKKGKELRPTDFGKMMIEHVNVRLTVPDTTAEMEYRLTEIAQGKQTLAKYLDEVVSVLYESIQHAEQHVFPAVTSGDGRIPCPVCQHGCLVRRYSRKTQRYFHVCSNPACISPTSGRKLFYDDIDGKPLVEKCPTCGDVLVHFNKPDRSFWLCEKCDRFYSDIGGKPVVSNKVKGRA